MKVIIWTDRVRSEEVLLIVKEERNVLHAIKRRNWTAYILCRNCILKYVTAGKLNGK
jgi:hypothetical protein